MNPKNQLLVTLLTTALTMSAQKPMTAPAGGKQISDELIGIFFEDISSSADGGLYAELVQNGSFEFNTSERDGWGAGTAWRFQRPGHSAGYMVPQYANPLNENNPTYMRLHIERVGHYYDFNGWTGVGIQNDGFDGIRLKKGEKYNFSMFARNVKGDAKKVRVVAVKMEKMKKAGQYSGKFAAQHHFFGYEGRCAAPSNFDADYCYALGTSAAQLIANGKTGYMAIVKNTTAPAEQWIAGGVPITMMMNMERRNGEMKPVIRKALVELDGAPFKTFAAQRDDWAKNTAYIYPGPIQYWGPTEVCDQPTRTLALEQAK